MEVVELETIGVLVGMENNDYKNKGLLEVVMGYAMNSFVELVDEEMITNIKVEFDMFQEPQCVIDQVKSNCGKKIMRIRKLYYYKVKANVINN